MKTQVRVFAPATVSNLGPGFDLLGAALEGPGDEVTVRVSSQNGVRIINIEGDENRLPREVMKNTAGIAAHEVLKLADNKKELIWKSKKVSLLEAAWEVVELVQ